MTAATNRLPSGSPRTLDEARDEIRFSNRGGFAFLIVHGLTWIAAAILSQVLSVTGAALVFLFQGVVAFPGSLLLENALGYRRLTSTNPFTPLVVQVAMVQAIALPASIIVYNLEPLLVPATFAATNGGHFLPYVWMHRTRIYAAVAVIAGLGPFAIAVAAGRTASFHYSGYVVGATLLVAGVLIWMRVGRELGVRARE